MPSLCADRGRRTPDDPTHDSWSGTLLLIPGGGLNSALASWQTASPFNPMRRGCETTAGSTEGWSNHVAFRIAGELWRRRDERTPFGPSRRDSNPRFSLERASPCVVISPTSTPGATARCHRDSEGWRLRRDSRTLVKTRTTFAWKAWAWTTLKYRTG